MKKRHYDSDQTKKDISEKAMHIFSQKGFNQTSVEDISRASGYSKGHIYYHFGNKEKLFVLLAQNTMNEWYDKWMLKEPSFQTATEKLYAIADHVLHNYQTPLLKAGQELAANPSSNLESVKKLYELSVIPMKTYKDILQEGVERGEFKQGNIDQWTVLLGTWLGGLCHLTNTEQLQSLKPLFHEAVTMFLNSIRS